MDPLMSRPARLEPIAVISLDRRKLWGDDIEQWVYDGPTILRDLEGDSGDWLDYILNDLDVRVLDGNRFIVYADVQGHRDYWGEYDAWVEGYLLVPMRPEEAR